MKKNFYRLPTQTWTIERAIFLIASIFILLSVGLGLYHSEKWFYFTAFVGVMLLILALTGWCTMGFLLGKFTKLQSLSQQKK